MPGWNALLIELSSSVTACTAGQASSGTQRTLPEPAGRRY